MFEAGQSPQMIIVMLTRFFTQLWKLSDVRARRMPEQEIAREIGVPVYYLKQYLEFRSNFDVNQIEQNFKALLEADTVLKSTSRDPHLVLDLLIISLLHHTSESVHETV
jgi:DNA polymerase-3 subunit delta